jgi:hypothetical protein
VTPSLAKQMLSQLSYPSQLARVGGASGSSFVRLRGSGGDGGVECYADLTDDTRAAGVRRRSSMAVTAALSPSSFR